MLRRKALRERVIEALAPRDLLTVSQWHAEYCEPIGVTEPVVGLVLHELQQHTGAPMGRARPDDQMAIFEASKLSHGDWDLDLWDSFRDRFGVRPNLRTVRRRTAVTLGELLRLVQDVLDASPPKT